MSPPWGERMKPATSCTSRPRRCPIPCGRNTLVTALAIASSAPQRVMSASRSSSARSRWVRSCTSRQSTPARTGAKRLLHLIHPAYEQGEIGVPGRVGAGDVARIALELRSGVDEERVPLARRLPLQHLVVQHRAAGIQRDDGVVGQLLLALPAALEECQLDPELRGARRKGALRRPVAARTEPAGLAEAVELVGRFDRARKIQPPHEA